VAKGQKRRLEPGNVITIEPACTRRESGIRIEDDVAIHPICTEVLTRAPAGSHWRSRAGMKPQKTQQIQSVF